MILAPGIHPEVPSATYHSDALTDQPSLSASIAVELVTKSPAHAKAAHPRLNPYLVREDKPAFDRGTVVHQILLEGKDPLDIVELLSFDGYQSNAAKDARDYARSQGKIPLLDKHWDNVRAMCDAAREQIAAYHVVPPLLTDGVAEATLVWDDGGVACRSRLDWLRNDHAAIDDIKTSHGGDPKKFSRTTVYDYGYAIRAAFYLRGLAAVRERDGLPPIDTAWRWIVIEASAPYAVAVVSPSDEVLAYGNAKVEEALEKWSDCLEADVWPTYANEVHVAEAPPWVLRQISDQYEESAWAAL